MSAIDAIFEARRKAQEELRSLYETHGVADLPAEVRSTEETLSETIKDLQVREANLIAGVKADEAALEARQALNIGEAVVEEVRSDDADTQLRELARGERRSVELGYESRDNVNLVKGTATDGPELVESTLLGTIHDLMVEESPIMQAANVIRTAGGADLIIPRVTSHSAASVVNEAAAIGKDAPQFGTVTLGATKYGFLVQISRELEADSAFNVAGFVTSQGAAALGRGLNAAFVAELLTADTGLTASSATAVTMDELITAQHSVIPAQRARGTWLVNDDTVQAVRKLKDGNDNYIWRPGAVAGAPDELLGRPIMADPYVPAQIADGTFGVFGDMSGFYVRLAQGITVDRSDHVGFSNDLVTYRFLARADSAIVDTTGIRKLVAGS